MPGAPGVFTPPLFVAGGSIVILIGLVFALAYTVARAIQLARTDDATFEEASALGKLKLAFTTGGARGVWLLIITVTVLYIGFLLYLTYAFELSG